MATIADLLIRLGVDADDVESGMAGAADVVDRNFAKITAAGVAAGAGLEAFARQQGPVNTDLRKLAASTGITEDAMRDLVKETSNVTFPLDEVIGVMEKGRQQGLKSAEQLQDFANFWDMVGDATGENAVTLSEAGVALRAVGIAAGDESEALGAFGFIAQETTGDVGEFLQFLERTGPELREMGAGVDDAAAIMGVLEKEFGMTARVARTEFRKAVNEADGDMGKMLDTLGVSADQFDEYRGAVGDSSGVIERNAQLHADSFTPMQKLSHAASELMLKHGGLADAAGALAMPLMALGPIMKGITSVVPALVKGFAAIGKGALVAVKGIGAKIVAWTVMGAKSLLAAGKVALAWIIAMGPIALVIAAVVGLVVLIVKNWDTIVEVTRKAWDWIVDKFRSAVDWVVETWQSMWESVTGAATKAIDFVKAIPGKILDALTELATKVWDFIVEYHPVAILLRKAREYGPQIIGWLRALPGRIVDAIAGFASTVWNFIVDNHPVAILLRKAREFWPDLLSWLQGLPARIVSGIGQMKYVLLEQGKDLIRGLWDGIKSMGSWLADKITGFVTDRIPGPIARALGMKSPSKVAADLARDIPRGMVIGMDAEARTLARAAERMAMAALPELGVPRVSTLTSSRTDMNRVATVTGSGRQTSVIVPVSLDGREIARSEAFLDEFGRVTRTRSRLAGGL